jgi:hypothetical protein
MQVHDRQLHLQLSLIHSQSTSSALLGNNPAVAQVPIQKLSVPARPAPAPKPQAKRSRKDSVVAAVTGGKGAVVMLSLCCLFIFGCNINTRSGLVTPAADLPFSALPSQSFSLPVRSPLPVQRSRTAARVCLHLRLYERGRLEVSGENSRATPAGVTFISLIKGCCRGERILEFGLGGQVRVTQVFCASVGEECEHAVLESPNRCGRLAS